jgi:hypothetical protein
VKTLESRIAEKQRKKGGQDEEGLNNVNRNNINLNGKTNRTLMQ